MARMINNYKIISQRLYMLENESSQILDFEEDSSSQFENKCCYLIRKAILELEIDNEEWE